jgi:hypothetical protein
MQTDIQPRREIQHPNKVWRAILMPGKSKSNKSNRHEVQHIQFRHPCLTQGASPWCPDDRHDHVLSHAVSDARLSPLWE